MAVDVSVETFVQTDAALASIAIKIETITPPVIQMTDDDEIQIIKKAQKPKS